MSRIRRPISLAFAAAMLSTLLPFSVGTADAQTSFSTVEICSGREDAPLDVSLILDKSGSIKTADPSELRLEAVDAFLDGLLRLAEGEDGRDVSVSIWLFDTATRQLDGVPEWQSLNSEADVRLLSGAVEAGWNNDAVGGDTDQIIAFSEAFDQVERVQQGSDQCSVVVMFTDGVLDTINPGQNEEDLPRVQSEACSNTNLYDEPSLRERAQDLGTNEFILMLEPTGNIPQFEERLTSTVTLFAAITGDTDIPQFAGDVQVTARDLDCQPKHPEQSGEILSAADVGDLVASFLKLSAGVRGGQSAIESCPANIQDGTDALPAGGLIAEIDVINFDSGDTPLTLADFEINVAGVESAADTALTQIGSSTPEGFVLEVTDPTALPAGWKLQAKNDSEYCVELFERSDLIATISDSSPLQIAEIGQVEDVVLEYSAPIMGEVELTITMNGALYSSDTATISLPLNPDMRPDNVPIDSSGTLRALGVEGALFNDIPVKIQNVIVITDYSSEALPTLMCESEELQIAVGEVPESGSQTIDTTCSAIAGSDVDGLKSFIRVEAEAELPGRSALTFTTSDGTLVTESWTEFTGQVGINSTLDGMPNQFYEGTGTATFSVSYGSLAESAAEIDSAPLALTIDIEPRSDRTIALEITALVTVLSALLSLLLLWVFNRMTAQLPRAGDFFYYETGDPSTGRSGIGDSLDPNKLGAARGERGSIQFGEVAVRLVHPPLWKPLADSIGVIEAPGAAAADPTGPREGTIPVGFASLVIGYRMEGLEEVRYVAVVPKQGARAGIDGVRSILNDRIRLERVERRLPDSPAVDDTPDGEGPGVAPVDPKPPDTPNPKGTGPGSVPIGRESPDSQDGSNKKYGPSGPTLPGGSGPRLPG